MAKKKKQKTTVKRKTKDQLQQEEEIKQWITIVVLLAIAIVAYMRMGFVGRQLNNMLRFLFGKFYLVMIALMIAQVVITIINHKSGNTLSKNPIAIIFLISALLMIFTFLDVNHDLKGFEILQEFTEDIRSYFGDNPPENVGGGIIGALLLSISTMLVDWNGSILVIIVFIIIAALLLVNLKVYKQAFATIKEYLSTEDEEVEIVETSEVLDLPTIPPTLEKVEIKAPKNSTITQITADLDTTRELEMRERVQQPKPYVPSDDTLQIPTDNFSGINLSNLEKVELGESDKSLFIDVEDLVDRHDGPVQSVSYEREEIDEHYEPRHVPEPQEYIEDETGQIQLPIREEPQPTKIVGEPTSVTSKMVDYENYRIPNYRRLLMPVAKSDAQEENKIAAVEKGELLIQVLRNFDIEAVLSGYHIGPAVTQFEIKPDQNVKVSRIQGLADNIKMQLAAKDIRIEAPIPGRPYVGVEIPNAKSTPVYMKEIFDSSVMKEDDHPLTIAVGKNLQGEVVTCRLDKMPHLLIAGATGSGKSVCMNTIITSILLRTKPDEVKLLLVDPKKVEFTPYHEIPHLIGPVVNDALQASNALKVIVKMMDERYNLFAAAGVRNIDGYNEKVRAQGGRPNPDGSPAPKKLPYVVVIIDELADLMMVAGKEVESSIQRITQLARAAGIHLIVATQRPSVDVITGIIKANIPSRIAFSVSSSIDSRTILDRVGAERLLGNGDMLYMPIGESAPLRVQGVYVTDKEVGDITTATKKQGRPLYDDAFIRLENIDSGDGLGGIVGADSDPLLEEIKEYVVEAQKASTSLLQRRFGIGYNRAARMIDVLEEQGIIGPAQGSKPREVYLKKTTSSDE